VNDEEDLRRRHVLRACIDQVGYPVCMGAAARGPEHCTCELPPQAHDESVLVAHAHLHERGGKPCRDCAFRRGSPEMESGEAQRILERNDADFRCHQGMPIDARHGEAELGNFAPDDAHRYPVCPGWVAFKLARIYRQEHHEAPESAQEE
jgi:hypothetical protein